MDALTIHLLGALGVTLLALLVYLVVQRPLLAILVEICGAAHRASFWARLYAATLVLTVLFFTLVRLPDDATAAAVVLVGVLRSGLFGLLFSLLVLALVMLGSIRSHDGRQRLERRLHAAPRSEPSAG